MLETGAATEEVCSLRCGDYLAGSKLLVIRSRPLSRRYSRTIPLSAIATRLIERAYRDGNRTPEEPLFTNRHGRPLTTSCLRSRMREVREAAGLERLTGHMLVQDFIVSSIWRNIDPGVLKDYLGAKSPDLILSHWQSVPRNTERQNDP